MIIIDFGWLEVEIGITLIDGKFFIFFGDESGWSFTFGPNEAGGTVAGHVFIIVGACASIETVAFVISTIHLPVIHRAIPTCDCHYYKDCSPCP